MKRIKLSRILVLAAISGLGLAANAGTYKRTDKLTSPWLQAHFEKSQEIKAAQGVNKMCAAGSALYNLNFEPGELGNIEAYLNATIAIIKAPLEEYVETLPAGKTKITNLITKPTNPLTAERVDHHLSRVYDSQELKQDFTNRLHEFQGSKLFLHTDLIYRRRVKPGTPILDNFLRAYTVLDLENKQAMVVLGGDCQF